MQVVEWLLENGSSVDSQSQAGTPLLWAAGSGQAAIVKALLRAGADPNAAAADGTSAVLLAAAAGAFLCSQSSWESA